MDITSIIQPDWSPTKIKMFLLTRKHLNLFGCKKANDEIIFQLDLKYRDQSPIKLEFPFTEQFKDCKMFIEPKLCIKYYLIIYYEKKSKR
jgi:hypothetical protein